MQLDVTPIILQAADAADATEIAWHSTHEPRGSNRVPDQTAEGLKEIGAMVLGAVDAEDLTAALDEVLESPSRWWHLVMRKGTEAMRVPSPLFAVDETDVRLLGKADADRLAVGMRYAEMVFRWAASTAKPESLSADAPDIVAMVTDPTGPFSLRKLLLRQLRSIPAVLALGVARKAATTPARWLLTALVDCFCEGQYAALRLAALASGDPALLAAVQPGDRLDDLSIAVEVSQYRWQVDQEFARHRNN